MKSSISGIVICFVCCMFLLISGCVEVGVKDQKAATTRSGTSKISKISAEARTCIECHKRKQISSIALRDWQFSTHAERGVTCLDCHIPVSGASKNIVQGTTLCDDKNVRRSVSPKNCEECHSDEAKQFAAGKHANAWTVLQDLQNSSEISGTFKIEEDCSGCHRIGRDDGKCDSCHTRHRFAASEARRPEACRTCHMGPAHPQWETYDTSKHGSIYSIEGQNWYWEKSISEWYKAPLIESPVIPRAPVCVTCHMPDGSHAIGVVSESGDDQLPNDSMSKVCSQCHTSSFSNDTLRKARGTVDLCDKLLARAINLVDGLYKDGIITKTDNLYPHIDVLRFAEFKNPIEKRIYRMMILHKKNAYMGAFHINPTYLHDYGLAEMKHDLKEIEIMANHLRK
ncbi:MAG: multiheme c-type cytochrome [Candidatus Anammoxibacter sp.]